MKRNIGGCPAYRFLGISTCPTSAAAVSRGGTHLA